MFDLLKDINFDHVIKFISDHYDENIASTLIRRPFYPSCSLGRTVRSASSGSVSCGVFSPALSIVIYFFLLSYLFCELKPENIDR